MKNSSYWSAVKFLGLALTLFMVSVGSTRNVHGQGFLISDGIERYHLPRPQPITHPAISHPAPAYSIREFLVDASIDQQIATTQVTQVFQNHGSTAMEVSFVFPLPYDGAVDQMTFLVDGKEYEAKLLKADEARKIYEGYLRRNQDPALLEWVGTGMFRSSVFPLPPGGTRTVTLRYSQLLRKDGSLTDYLFPLATTRYTAKPIEKVSFRVAISDAQEIKNVYSPTHSVDIKRDDAKNVVVSLGMANVIPQFDFRLIYDSSATAVQANLLSYWPEGEDQGYFVMLASPSIQSETNSPVRKSVIFVLDQSGSMSGQKIEQAREAAKFVLNNLNADDLFNIISYDGSVRSMSPELQRFGPDTRQTAVGFINGINAGGSTNIDDALATALKQISDDSLPHYVVFLTDGMPTAGETNELKIAENCKSRNAWRARVISFGVGYDVNSRLLDRITRDNFGQSEYVSPNENIEEAVSRLYKKISAPVLTKMTIDFQVAGVTPADGPAINRIYPQMQSELFAGNQLVMVGRYKKAGAAKIKIAGEVAGKPQTFEFDVEFSGTQTGGRYPFVAKIWAMRRIGEIIDLLDLKGTNQELIDELIKLSLKHGIVTPYTAYLADENSDFRQLSDYRFQSEEAGKQLAGLGGGGGGQAAFGLRSQKNSMKAVDNLAVGQDLAFESQQLAGNTGPATGIGGIPANATQLSPTVASPPRGTGGVAGDLGGERTSRGVSGVRQAGNSTIYKRGDVLFADNAIDVDPEKQKAEMVELTRFSDEWFKLTKTNSSDENAILADQNDGEILIVRFRGSIYRIK